MIAEHGHKPAMAGTVNRLFGAQDRGRRELEAGQTQEDLAEVRRIIEEDYAPYNAIADQEGRDAPQIAALLEDAIYLQALDLMQGGRPAAKAAKAAMAALVTDHHKPMGGFTLPTEYDAAAIGAYTDKVLEEHGHLGNDDDFGGEEEPPQVRWRTRPRRDGLELVDDTGKPVEDEIGKPIQINNPTLRCIY